MFPGTLVGQSNIVSTFPWMRSSSLAKSSRCNWRLEEKYGVKESHCSWFSGCGLGRHLRMHSINPEDGHISCRVLGTESKQVEESLSLHSDKDSRPNGLDSFVDVVWGENGTGAAEGSTLQGDSLDAEGLSDCSNSAYAGVEEILDEEASGKEREKTLSRKREFCKRCSKAASRCICGMIKTQDASQEATIQPKQEPDSQVARTAEDQVVKMATLGTKHIEKHISSIAIPSWISLQPDAGLLFPSEHAVDLRSVDLEFSSEDADSAWSDESARGLARKPPSQLIILDGTWSKAKRIFYENPWLHSLPHYRLPPSKGSSRYGIIRKEPKPGCMSTIESIVMALQTLEPETEGLDNLLDVFEFMMEDQKVCMGERYKGSLRFLLFHWEQTTSGWRIRFGTRKVRLAVSKVPAFY
ncbi:hypothetical protein R1flu_016804 [Riccia fluitans]|uniref:tRNA-uridine aminocarboxypropyltransferase n=1 Tax=Riccia fluitans TaxID=41844 RepID=A0ABD1YMW7_9MARC